MRRSFFGVYLCFLGKVCSLYINTIPHQHPLSVRLSHQFRQKICPRSLGPHLHPLSGRQPQVATCPLTCHPRNSWCCHCSGPGLLKKKKIKPHTVASGWERATQASVPNHPLPRQHSSRQQLQQINLPLTVHLD